MQWPFNLSAEELKYLRIGSERIMYSIGWLTWFELSSDTKLEIDPEE